MKRIRPFFLLTFFLLASCSPTPTPTPTSSTLGAGFRYSNYGPAYDSGPEYWTSVSKRMTALFLNTQPMGIWIIGDIEGSQAYLNFPGTSTDPNIHFGKNFAPASVGFQYGYPNDQVWWGKLQNPPADIGNAILAAAPNTEALVG
jgi:hypothetical protein